ncbi:MAG: hypothetical protein U9P88_01385 [Patescibacteria group bacterium]|nr:hypothetical protein [Patescibacteria group bacterium]
MLISILIAGFGGGVIRGLVGFIKHQFSYKYTGFSISYFLGMCFLSGIVGFSSVVAIKGVGFNFMDSFTPALSFIVGYAGGDFIENIYKIIIKKPSLYSLSNKLKDK